LELEMAGRFTRLDVLIALTLQAAALSFSKDLIYVLLATVVASALTTLRWQLFQKLNAKVTRNMGISMTFRGGLSGLLMSVGGASWNPASTTGMLASIAVATLGVIVLFTSAHTLSCKANLLWALPISTPEAAN
jgi:hypothetical protein